MAHFPSAHKTKFAHAGFCEWKISKLISTAAYMAGGRYVTSTRIQKPTVDRAFFHLVYATRHWKGIIEFRAVEKKAVDEQEAVRHAAKSTARISRTGQNELFSTGEVLTGPRTYEAEREKNLKQAQELFVETLTSTERITFGELLGKILKVPLVWESDAKGWVRELLDEEKIAIPGLSRRSKTPKYGDSIIWIG